MQVKRLGLTMVVFSGALALAPAVWSQSPSGAGSSGMHDKSGHSGMSSRMDSQQSASPSEIKQVQEALRNKGYNPGAADGIMGPRTQQALRQFQSTENLQVTGQLDSNTASALGVSYSSNSPSGNANRSGAMGGTSPGTTSPDSASNRSREGTGPGDPEGRAPSGKLPGAGTAGSGSTSNSSR